MEIKGIAKGDKDLRHFTFDDSDYVVRGGVYYYKVNYGKNKLEGEYGEDEIGYVECDKVLALGGKKPRPIPGREVPQKEVKEVVQEPVQTKTPGKRGRPPKVKSIEVSGETIPVAAQGVSVYEYVVMEIKVGDVGSLQDKLNNLGNEGWELCGFDTNKSLMGAINMITIFKRKRG